MSKAAKAIRRYAEGYRIVPHTGRATKYGSNKEEEIPSWQRVVGSIIT